jgi:hypothetical protein
MQNAKDTFYITLRDRIAALNPARTIVVRGITRPGVVVEENELVSAYDQADVFRLRWTGLQVDPQGALPLITMRCQILYSTAGGAGNGGMDRGRLLTAMDAELAAALSQPPRHTVKTNYATTQPSAAMRTHIFWNDAVFQAEQPKEERLERAATVDVFSYQEAGEL